MRAFIAIPIPEEVRRSVAELQRELARAEADVKWVEPALLHVTLKFLGDIDARQHERLIPELSAVAAAAAAFSCALDEPGTFPDRGIPRVVWVGVGEGHAPLRGLAGEVERAAVAAGCARDARGFSAHLTLGRVRSGRGSRLLREALESVAWRPPPGWTIGSAGLYQSVLGPAGPRYTVLREFPLGSSNVL